MQINASKYSIIFLALSFLGARNLAAMGVTQNLSYIQIQKLQEELREPEEIINMDRCKLGDEIRTVAEADTPPSDDYKSAINLIGDKIRQLDREHGNVLNTLNNDEYKCIWFDFNRAITLLDMNQEEPNYELQTRIKRIFYTVCKIKLNSQWTKSREFCSLALQGLFGDEIL